MIENLPDADKAILQQLLSEWSKKRYRNVLRTTYYEGKQLFRDFGISIPPQLRSFEPTLGWIAKGVDALVDRTNFEGFVTPDEQDFGVSEIVFDNNLESEFPQSFTSSAMHSCSFLTVTSGGDGEPDVLVMPRAADESAALWDSRRRAVSAFLTVTSWEHGAPDGLLMMTPERVYRFTKVDGKWFGKFQTNPVGEVLAVALPYKPDLKRPFGHSRISRAAMSITDAALRTVLRAEVSSEFYSSPQRWVLGADVEAFSGDNKWKAVMGRLLALERDPETDELPSVGQFAATSPQPHTEQLRMWASLFAGEMGLSLNSLGIIQDNPSSAEAMYAAKEDLITDAIRATSTWGRSLVKAMQLAVMLRDGLDSVPAGMKDMRAQFTDPSMSSPAAQADAFVKRAQVIPGFAESEVGLEMAGLTRGQITRFKAETKRVGAQNLLASLSNDSEGTDMSAITPSGDSAEDLREKFEALGVAVRAGVDPESAAAILGIGEIKFTGAVPVTLRVPESEARTLEES